jgi:8-oxo-dGTP pyrophosphatase MutT (NUDIX family)
MLPRMTRHELITHLESHSAHDKAEARDIVRMIRLLETVPDCFHRHEMKGHITGAALLLSRDGTKTLMNFHKSLGRWLQFGGHSDGDEDTFAVAARELREESGITEFEQAMNGIFDVDVHPIPANPKRGEEAHEHYDILLLFRCTGSEDFTVSDESDNLKWMSADEVLAVNDSPRFQRLVAKWQAWQRTQKRAA